MEDLTAISQLKYRYLRTLDTKDWVGFADCFLPTATGDYNVTLVYLDGSTTGRSALVSANGGATQTVSFTPTGSFDTIGAKTITVHLNQGANTITLANPSDYAPDFDRIFVAQAPAA